MKAKRATRKICASAVLAALYAAITIAAAPLSYGPVQFRLSEALVVLCAFEPFLGVGLTLGCFLANLFSTVTALDMVVGTLATAAACLWTSRLGRNWLIPLPNVLVNAVVIGGMLAFVLYPENIPLGFAVSALQVGLGEAAVMYVLGLPLLLFARRTGFVDRILGNA